MTLHQYDYIFAIGTLFALLDAFNNGASMSTRSPISSHLNLLWHRDARPWLLGITMPTTQAEEERYNQYLRRTTTLTIVFR